MRLPYRYVTKHLEVIAYKGQVKNKVPSLKHLFLRPKFLALCPLEYPGNDLKTKTDKQNQKRKKDYIYMCVSENA